MKLSNTTVSTQDVPYDTKSIMHYGAYSFSRNGKPTIEPQRQPGVSTSANGMGQRIRLTSQDLQHINRLYGCEQSEGKCHRHASIESSNIVPDLKIMLPVVSIWHAMSFNIYCKPFTMHAYALSWHQFFHALVFCIRITGCLAHSNATPQDSKYTSLVIMMHDLMIICRQYWWNFHLESLGIMVGM